MKYITGKDTNKMIRAELAKAFPSIKFSVKLTPGGSCRIKWTDGPTEPQVEAVANKFQGASFDPMIDLKSYNVSVLNGEEVSFGVDFIFADREYSDAGEDAIFTAFAKKYGTFEGTYTHDRWLHTLRRETALPCSS
jgi:hypothetical protein